MANFEQQITTLEALVDKMEKNELSLEESMENFEQGIKIVRECQSALAKAEQKIAILQQNKLEDFKP